VVQSPGQVVAVFHSRQNKRKEDSKNIGAEGVWDAANLTRFGVHLHHDIK